MLKKFILMFLVCLIINLTSAEASYQIEDSQVSLGGITPGMRMSEVIKVFGQPDKIDLKKELCVYGTDPWPENRADSRVFIKLFYQFVGLKLDGSERIESISVSSNNGFATPDGVKVGMDASILKQKYGEPDGGSSNTLKSYYSFLYAMRFTIKPETNKITSIRVEAKDDYFMKTSNAKYAAMARATGK